MDPNYLASVDPTMQVIAGRRPLLSPQQEAVVAGPGGVLPNGQVAPMTPAQGAGDPRAAAAAAMMAGSQSLGARGGAQQMTPQQQAQLVQMLRARGMQKPQQPPPQAQPAAPQVPIMANAQPVPGMPP